MSEQLLRAIEMVQSEIEKHFDFYRQNEEQTKQSLINPILNALGWNTFDRARVQQQYRAGRGKVDMALMREDKPVVLIEAKSLDELMGEDAIDQIIRYCTWTPAQTAVITNGKEWRVYRPWLKNLGFEDRLLFQICLDKDKVQDVANCLSMLGYDVIGQLEEKDLRILLEAYWNAHASGELLKSFTGILRDALVTWSGKPPGEVKSSEVNSWLHKKLFATPPPPLLPDPNYVPDPLPVPGQVRFVILGGERIQIRYVKDVLILTAEWLVRQGRLDAGHCPVRLGRGQRYLVHIQAQHSNGSPFAGPKTLSNGLILESNFSAADSARRAFELLANFGYRPGEILQLEY